MKEHYLPFLGEYSDWCLLGRPDYSLHACRRHADSDDDLEWTWYYYTSNRPATAYVKLLEILSEKLSQLRNGVVAESDRRGENSADTQIYWLVGYADNLTRSGHYAAVNGELYAQERQDLLADMYGLIQQFHKYLGREFDERTFDERLKREWRWAMNSEAFDRWYWYDEDDPPFGSDAVGWFTEEGRE